MSEKILFDELGPLTNIEVIQKYPEEVWKMVKTQQATIATLTAEHKKLVARDDVWHNKNRLIQEDLAKAWAELTELRKDRDRLDWLEKNEISLSFLETKNGLGSDYETFWTVDQWESHYSTPREAIDLALQEG